MLHVVRPSSVYSFKETADRNLEAMTRDYINGGSGNELTLRANSLSFDSYFIQPQVFSLTTSPHTAATMLGASVSAPIGIAPTAFHKLAHPHGEIATSLAAQSCGAIYTISCLATTSLAQLNAIQDMRHVWVQLLTFKDRSMMRAIIKRAESYGCGAIVVTADAPVSGNRKKDTSNKFRLPSNMRMELLHEYASFNHYASADGSILDSFFDDYIDPFFNWDDIKAIVDSTQLPVVLKGIVRAEDVQKAYAYGVKAIIVSNHGGRQLDGCVPTLAALEVIAKTIQCPIEIYMDGGVRSGTDVFKALALGARAVFIGRPILWALAAYGQQGVEDVLGILKKELEHTMYLSGVPTVEKINQQMIWRGK